MNINIIGAGLAGVEAALFLARKGIAVTLYEMKRNQLNEAQSSSHFGELVCSNSLRGLGNAPGELKRELYLAGSPLIHTAFETRVPAGNALAVDRALFGASLTAQIEGEPLITLIEEEVTTLNGDDINIIATGPLTTEPLLKHMMGLLETENVYFYDAIAPIVDGATLDYDIIFRASRWDKGEPGGDYLNCPMNREQYEIFIEKLAAAEKVPLHQFEKPKYFQGCLPVEVMLERGRDALRFGPMKPVGLIDPKRPDEKFYAVVQLRAENLNGSYYNLVGFQTKLTYKGQKEAFSAIPGLEKAVFARYGSIHRNTFVNAPMVLSKDLSAKNQSNLYLTGQLSGVEGYIESIAMGLFTALSVYKRLKGEVFSPPDGFTAMGALYNHLVNNTPQNFQPSNINFSLFNSLALKRMKKKERNEKRVAFAEETFRKWLAEESDLNRFEEYPEKV